MTCEEIDEMEETILGFVKRCSRQSLENFMYCELEDKWENNKKKSVKELMKEFDEDERYILQSNQGTEES
tara:strand:+ start:1908 stop:2117 length:210 start_codon:yes stop_codon:yes gene_type:complete